MFLEDDPAAGRQRTVGKSSHPAVISIRSVQTKLIIVSLLNTKTCALQI